MDAGEEKHMCSVGTLSAKPGKVAEEGRPLLGMALKMYSWTQGGTHSSKASIPWHSNFFTVQLSHPYMYWKNDTFD